MNHSPRKLILSVFAGLSAVTVSPLLAQTAPTPSAAAEEAVKLDPFSVKADSDVGFVAASALAGGRIATALKDTPVAYSVMTKEFLEAFNITDISQAAQFSVNSNYYEGDGSNQGFARGPATSVRIRGQLANAPTRNFFAFDTTSDSYNLDRVDFARGPNAVLFGSGGAGGTQNTVTKQPNTSRPVRQLIAQIGSFNRTRLTADVNQPLSDKAAVRVNLLWASGDTWREHEWEDRVGVHLAGLYKLTPTLTLRGEVEYRKTSRLQGWQVHQDQVSAWDGRTTTSGFNPAMTAGQMARAGIARYPSQFVWRPEWNQAVNFQNQFQTKGAAYNATFANTNYINDKPIRSVGFSLSNAAMIDVWDHPDRYTAVKAGSPFFQVPRRDELALWDSTDRSHPTYTEIGRDAALYLTYTPFKDFFVEIAGDTNNVPKLGNNAGRRNLLRTMVDINRTLPTGEPNPHFLERFSDYLIYEAVRRDMYDNLRVQTAYVRETRFGKLQMGLMAGKQVNRVKNRTQLLLLPLFHLVPDYRAESIGAQSNEYAIYTRIYHNERDRNALYPSYTKPVMAVDPVTNVRSIGAPALVYSLARTDAQWNQTKIGRFWQAAGNFDLLKNRVVLIGAFRRDFQDFHQVQTRVAGDMPQGWDGRLLTFLPDAPADYLTLEYTPKNAAGKAIGSPVPAETRPRIPLNGVQVPAPQYANDRFQDDYSPTGVISIVNTSTVGAVLNVNRWLGVYANKSSTFALGEAKRNLYNRVNPPTASHGRDAGIRVTLPNGKLAVSLGWYDAYQDGAQQRVIGGLGNAQNAIYSAPVVGDLTTGATNIRGLQAIGNEIWSTYTSTTTGYEAEITANLTSSWRLTLNLATNDAKQKDPYPEVPKFIADNEPIERQVLADAGVLIDANNVARINPTLDDPTKINQIAVQAAVDGWNALQTTVKPNLTAARGPAVKSAQSIKLSGNLATDYRFTRGRLAGLRLGIGMNYRTGQIIGNRSGDTIPDPNNPLNAIDDPATDLYSYMYGSSYIKGTGTVSYTVRFKESRPFLPKTVQFDLTIDNLFRRHAPITGFTNVTNEASTAGVVLVPRNNDISNPSRMSVPGNVTYLAPMNWMLSAKMDF